MIVTIEGISVSYPAKLETRKAEIEDMVRGMGLSSIKKNRMVKVWETKRHDLAALVVKA